MSEIFTTTIDPDTGRVDVPMNLTLEWFDRFREGIVGIVTLVPAELGDGTWTFTVEDVPAVNEAAIQAAAEREDEE